ncbi:DinB family protein [Flavobacteriales bacterium]|nr:DinB family protein [Flavobacteriales bacterium]
MKHNFDAYFEYYVNQVQGMSIGESLAKSLEETLELFGNMREDLGDYAYADGKWTVKQLLAHLVDTERIFCNRALRFARNDNTELPGYDHDMYVNYDNAKNRSLHDVVAEYKAVRIATKYLFNSFSEEMLDRKGKANGLSLNVGAIGLIIGGHNRHHLDVIKERYLSNE